MFGGKVDKKAQKLQHQLVHIWIICFMSSPLSFTSYMKCKGCEKMIVLKKVRLART